MRCSVFLLIMALSAAWAFAKEPKTEPSPDGFTLRTEYYEAGAVRSVTRLDGEGQIVAVHYHGEDGVLQRSEELDESGRARSKTFYGADGKPTSEEIYTEAGSLQSLKAFDPLTGSTLKLSIFGPEQKLIKQVQFKDGKPEKAQEFYLDGSLKVEHQYDTTGKELRRVEYFPSGEVYSITSYTEMGLESKSSFEPADQDDETEASPQQ